MIVVDDGSRTTPRRSPSAPPARPRPLSRARARPRRATPAPPPAGRPARLHRRRLRARNPAGSPPASAARDADLVQGRCPPTPAPAGPFDRTIAVDCEHGLYETANLLFRRELFDRSAASRRSWPRQRQAARRGRLAGLARPPRRPAHRVRRRRARAPRGVPAHGRPVHRRARPAALLPRAGRPDPGAAQAALLRARVPDPALRGVRRGGRRVCAGGVSRGARCCSPRSRTACWWPVTRAPRPRRRRWWPPTPLAWSRCCGAAGPRVGCFCDRGRVRGHRPLPGSDRRGPARAGRARHARQLGLPRRAERHGLRQGLRRRRLPHRGGLRRLGRWWSSCSDAVLFRPGRGRRQVHPAGRRRPGARLPAGVHPAADPERAVRGRSSRSRCRCTPWPTARGRCCCPAGRWRWPCPPARSRPRSGPSTAGWTTSSSAGCRPGPARGPGGHPGARRAGLGYWSLVIGTICGAWAAAVAAVRASPYPLRLRWRARGGPRVRGVLGPADVQRRVYRRHEPRPGARRPAHARPRRGRRDGDGQQHLGVRQPGRRHRHDTIYPAIARSRTAATCSRSRS